MKQTLWVCFNEDRRCCERFCYEMIKRFLVAIDPEMENADSEKWRAFVGSLAQDGFVKGTVHGFRSWGFVHRVGMFKADNMGKVFHSTHLVPLLKLLQYDFCIFLFMVSSFHSVN